ncbi:MAG: flavodoxin family protein [Alphaproteobacteria bacterium]|nr:flavodoxin family protein [Alphaproteobacteria bacterium]MBO4644694.1 flavodoxin family protein [Alphaproteobacteria bacterium]
MKVLMINGSGNENGCTFTALSAVAETLKKENIETEIVQLGKSAYMDCIACMGCRKNGLNRCAFNDDIVNRIIEKAEQSDGFVFGSPVYYAHPSGRLLSVLDRVFYAGSSAFRFKPGAAVVCARRAGTTAALDVLNKYFGINQMPIASSTYWNMVHGKTPEDVMQDKEGLQSMHNLGKAMACLLKGEAPNGSAFVYGSTTNFIR